MKKHTPLYCAPCEHDPMKEWFLGRKPFTRIMIVFFGIIAFFLFSALLHDGWAWKKLGSIILGIF